jgi:hypothetical protein
MFNHVDHGIALPQITRQTTTSGRKYFTPEGNAYPSITTILGILKGDSIEKWRARVGAEEANRISTQAANRGTAVHKLCEDYLNNEEDWKGKHVPSNLFTFNTLKPVLDEHVNNVYFQEEFLYSDKLKAGGQVDCIAEWDGELSVIDFKTSRKPKQEEWILGYFIQAAFYAAAFYEQTGVPIKQGVVLIAVDDHEPQIFKIPTYEYLPHFMSVRKKYKELYES